MALRFLRLFACSLCALPAFAQQDASSRLQPVSGPLKPVVYEVRTGTLRSTPGTFVGAGLPTPERVYNNSCTSNFFAAMSPGDVFVDNGQIPGPTNEQLPGCVNHYPVGSFTTSYCTDQQSVDLTMTFHTLHASCTDITGVPGTGFAITGLPGSSSGLACWMVTIDLNGTSLIFTLNADGDGVYDAVAASDTFAATYEIANVTGTAGMVLAGNPVFLGQGCDFAVGTVFEVGDPTMSAPRGTGYGSTDAFGLVQGGMYAGCFFFGGWPGNDWASYYLEIDLPPSVDTGCDSPVGPPTCACDGNFGAAPCGNATFDMTGCYNSTSTSTGGFLQGFSGTMASVVNEDLVLAVSQLPPEGAGIFLVGTTTISGLPFFDGIYCLGGNTLRLNPGFSDAGGVRFSDFPGSTSLIGEANITAPGYFVALTTYWFQYWYRDIGGPCGSGANFSNVVPVTMQP